jgi:hypothetical protein
MAQCVRTVGAGLKPAHYSNHLRTPMPSFRPTRARYERAERRNLLAHRRRCTLRVIASVAKQSSDARFAQLFTNSGFVATEEFSSNPAKVIELVEAVTVVFNIPLGMYRSVEKANTQILHSVGMQPKEAFLRNAQLTMANLYLPSDTFLTEC